MAINSVSKVARRRERPYEMGFKREEALGRLRLWGLAASSRGKRRHFTES